ncbi:MAG: PTS lactose transporter subunit IIC [Rhodobacterales bacterium]|nr:MAG: PTS lactose transporter subunit IIC [Rhodobacterales bacterium]
MQIGEILSLDGVKALSGSSSKKRMFHDLGDLAADAYGLESDDVVQALLEREALGPTAVGHGVSLPHARMPGLESVRGLFLRLDQPVDCKAVDRKPVDLIFALLAPLDAGAEHLKALALVSRTLRNADVREKLRARGNRDHSTLHSILTEAQAIKAA